MSVEYILETWNGHGWCRSKDKDEYIFFFRKYKKKTYQTRKSCMKMRLKLKWQIKLNDDNSLFQLSIKNNLIAVIKM